MVVAPKSQPARVYVAKRQSPPSQSQAFKGPHLNLRSPSSTSEASEAMRKSLKIHRIPLKIHEKRPLHPKNHLTSASMLHIWWQNPGEFAPRPQKLPPSPSREAMQGQTRFDPHFVSPTGINL